MEANKIIVYMVGNIDKCGAWSWVPVTKLVKPRPLQRQHNYTLWFIRYMFWTRVGKTDNEVLGDGGHQLCFSIVSNDIYTKFDVGTSNVIEVIWTA